ncbi:TonB-dependent receptor [Granulicella tundricola]|nr:TonB-dependent receptor [Granulicella tundricola]
MLLSTAFTTGLAASALSLTVPSAYAQFRTSVQGSVTDNTGAAVPNATLTLQNLATNATVTHTSDASGVFNFNALPADHFKLTVTVPGFKTKVLSDLQFIPEQPNNLNVPLELGGVSETVTVDASENPILDTSTANIGATISANDIQHLPSFNRDVFTLTQLAPGAVSDGSQSAGGGVNSLPGNQGPGGSGSGGAAPTENRPQANANGSRNDANGISIDGISTVSAVWGGASVITPTEDSIDNVRIVTNDYDAENSRFSGAQTLVTSKAGTNHLHGSAFIAIHRPGLNAFQPSTGVGTPLRDTARFNQYGGSIGGPIWRDKLFAFFAYESSPNNSTATSTGWYETTAFRAAAPSGSIASTFLNFPGSAVAGTIVTTGETCALVGRVEGVNCRTIAGQGLDIGSPVKTGLGKQDLTADGTANNPGVGGGLDGVADVAFYSTATPSSSYYRQFNGRMDGNVTQKDHLSFTIYWVPQGTTNYNGGARAYNLFNHAQVNDAFSVIYNHTFSSNLLNEVRANASGWRWNEITSNPQQPVGLPQDNITYFGTSSATINQFGSSLGSILNQWTYGYKDILTKVAGAHTIKMGGDYTNLHYLNNPIGRPSYNFYNVWDFLNDAPYAESGQFNAATGLPGSSRSDDRENLFGGFVQDDWKALPNLTVHAGIRYSYFGPLYAKQGNLNGVQLGAGTASFTGLRVRNFDGLWTPQKGNFGPQLGFNYSPDAFHGNLVVRGGYGLNYNQEEIAITANSGFNPGLANQANFSFASPSNPGTNGGDIIYGISSSPTSLNGFAANPFTKAAYNTNGLPAAGNANIIIIGDGHGSLPTTYTQHFSLDTQYQLGRIAVLSAGYQGSVSRHLISHQTPNSLAVVSGAALNPLVPNGGGDFWDNEGSANNNALLLEAKHNSRQLSLDGQFMWSKSMDTNGSGPYYEDPYYPANPAFSYGRSDFNVGKSVKIFGLWQPVFFKGHSALEKIGGGWSLSGIFQYHTGFPFSPSYGIGQSLYCQQCGYQNVRPQYLGGAGNDHSNHAFINGSNFANPNNTAIPLTAVVNGQTTVVAFNNKYFNVPNYANLIQSSNGVESANLALPGQPGTARNSFDGPNYRNVDASLTKSFGIPNTRILGEGARFEIRADVFNLFNILNLNPGSVNTNIAANFGQDTTALGGRTISFQGRFSF